MQFFVSLLIFINLCLFVYSKYTLIDDYNVNKFADMFDFIENNDTSHGYVRYLNKDDAINQGLFKTVYNKFIYIGVDAKNKATSVGRNSVRIESKKIYNRGLFVLDLFHMPNSVCGSWPSFWLLSKDRRYLPDGGRINVIENVNQESFNSMALHSNDYCVVTNSSKAFTGELISNNCFTVASDQAISQGCQIRATRNDTYGDEFNRDGGGVYVMDWAESIRIWHFPRKEIPDDLKSENPKPDTWEKPLAHFFGNCDFDQRFRNQAIVFSVSFCGDWVDTTWSQDCSIKERKCTDFVRQNPHVFQDTYWLIKSLKVYSKIAAVQQSPQACLIFYIGVPSILIAIIVATCTFIWYYKQLQRRQNAIYALMNNFLKQIASQQRICYKDIWELEKENLIIQYDQKIGKGAFSHVYVGKLIGNAAVKNVYSNVIALSHFHDCKVAIKVLRSLTNEASKYDFQKEVNFMKALKFHTNIVTLLGYTTSGIQPKLVLEFCANGDLLHYLRNNKESFISNFKNGLTFQKLVSFASQISNGLNYFTSLGFIHRDVAARNVLLTSDCVCKLGDFGLCRTVDNQIYKSKSGMIPIRWMSIESLKSFEYSIESDVWSFAVLLYELFSLGDVPYPGVENTQILALLEQGKRLDMPLYCSNQIYDLMLSCWNVDLKNRPTFSNLCQFLNNVLENCTPCYNYVNAIDIESNVTTSVFNDLDANLEIV